VNVREVVRALRKNEFRFPRDLAQLKREEAIGYGVDRFLYRELRENLGIAFTQEELKDETKLSKKEEKSAAAAAAAANAAAAAAAAITEAQKVVATMKQPITIKPSATPSSRATTTKTIRIAAAKAPKPPPPPTTKVMEEVKVEELAVAKATKAAKVPKPTKVIEVKEVEDKEDEEETEDMPLTTTTNKTSTTKRTLKRMKRKMRTGLICDGVRVTQRNSQLENYRLSFSQLPDSLQKELIKLRVFLTRRRLGPQESPIATVTANKYEEHLRGILGWLVKEKEYKVEDLSSLQILFPNSKANAADVTFDYLQYLTVERGISANYELLITRSCIAAAKFLYGSKSKFQPGEDALPYHDIPLIKELRRLAKDAKSRASKSPLMSNEKLKWLDWGDYLSVCDTLKDEMALNSFTSHKRSKSAIAWSMQRYLIFAILSCVPDRQRTLRELSIGKTLIREEGYDDQGERWIIKHGPNDYKTGKDYGVRPPLVIAPELYPHLENFIANYREYLNPEHDFLFSRKNGMPFNDAGIYRLFTSTAMRLTGKRTNPHLIRDMIVTHLRRSNASEKELEALAIYMGHSLAMQKGSYDRRTISEKVEPAVNLLSTLNASFRS